MLHAVVRLLPGKPELAQKITGDVMSVVRQGEESVSVAFEEVDALDWTETVY